MTSKEKKNNNQIIGCSNCGAHNDPIQSFCLFCKTPLPSTKIDRISNEDLVMLCGEWIGYLEGVERKKGKLGIKIFKQVTEGETKENSNEYVFLYLAEVTGKIEKYLNLLMLRSSNKQFEKVIASLKSQYDKRLASISVRQKASFIKKLAISLLIAVTVIIVSVGLAVEIPKIMEMDEVNAERARLNELQDKISEEFIAENYADAYILNEKLVWQYKPDVYKNESEQWEKQQREMSGMIGYGKRIKQEEKNKE